MKDIKTIQDIFVEFEEKFNLQYHMSKDQYKAFNHIKRCRTEELGYHKILCESCGFEKITYNSCKDRHCPLCQSFKKEQWTNDRKSEVLGSKYFHVVLTLPKELDNIVLQNKRVLFSIMFKAAGEAIKKLCEDKKFMGAMPAITAVLHTWGQNLDFHPHIHIIISAGGLTKDNKWKESSEKFFVPVKVLSKVFRGKFMSYLKENYKNEEISFYGEAEKYKDINKFRILVNKLYNINWYSYVKRPFDNADAIIEYLARYTHRIAITNSRIVKVENGKVFFKYKDYKDKSKQKIMSLETIEFIRRFLMHVLPSKFVKIRYYGINANRNKRTKLKLCQKLTNILNNPLYKKLTKTELLKKITNGKAFLCPVCNKETLKLENPNIRLMSTA
ncbi:MAG: IS91 family transposase [Bacteroidales bacterium]|nr:IS91 family transposase [Bacteroidales bacterium]